ncbi:MAG TPA: penicillin acylase family protein [Gemmataceae bacterium]|nr:penicillin acylase family protein [Gemmataceae bacterium]
MRRLRRAIEAAANVLRATRLPSLLLRQSLPPRHETLHVTHLTAGVRILLDRVGVPHIYAQTSADLFFGQGYVHARDRLWQMELNRRVARGELAELFGERALETDRYLRHMGLRRAAEQEAATLDQEPREVLAAYVAGINAYIDRHRLPIEFTLLRFRPKPWDLVDSLAFGRYMGLSLSFNWEMELIRARLFAAVGPERAAELEPGVPQVDVPQADDLTPEDPLSAARSFFPLAGLMGGSNSWAVSGARSAAGRPLLAGDPHLSPSMPATWYVAHLHGGVYDVAGATLPGTPGVIIGHNARAAWSVTLAMADTQDLVLERADPARPHHFAFGDDWPEAEVRREEIHVRGQGKPALEEIVVTRHGPLLNGVLDIPAGGAALALRSAVYDWPTSLPVVLRLNRAGDWQEFRAALAAWAYPVLNFVYADVHGTIAYKMAGRVPLRARGDGHTPVPGWDRHHEWIGYVPFDDLPEALNPAEGVLASANSRPDVPCAHFLARDWVDDWRRQRIMTLLRARQRHSVSDFQAMQGDVLSLPALATARRLSELAREGEQPDAADVAWALACLSAWDGQLSPDSVAAAVYEVFRRELLRLVNGDLPDGLLAYTLGQGLHERLGVVSAFHFRGSAFLLAHLDRLLGSGSGGRETVRQALRSAVGWLREQLGPDRTGWQWGRLHQITFAHALGQAPLLGRLFGLSRGPFPVGGDTDTIAQSGIDPWRPYAAGAFTVSYRQVLDVGDWDRSLFILPTGQSGHPASPHFDDMMDAWRKAEHRPLWFSAAAVEAQAAETINLLREQAPGGASPR